MHIDLARRNKYINSDLKHVWGVFYPVQGYEAGGGTGVLTPGYDKQIETFSLKYNHHTMIVKE